MTGFTFQDIQLWKLTEALKKNIGRFQKHEKQVTFSFTKNYPMESGFHKTLLPVHAGDCIKIQFNLKNLPANF